jgi:NAD(P)-dependent dehydrogenase (short-subunit alcohol dehydrogenase family)
MKQVIPLMVGQGGGSIINISSIASIRYTGVPYATYSASKAALNQLTRTTAVEYASRRVRVNAILPGLMKTPMVEKSAAPRNNANLFSHALPSDRSGYQHKGARDERSDDWQIGI